MGKHISLISGSRAWVAHYDWSKLSAGLHISCSSAQGWRATVTPNKPRNQVIHLLSCIYWLLAMLIIDRTGPKAEAPASEKYLAYERGDGGSKLTPHTIIWLHCHKILNSIEDTEELAETWLCGYEGSVQCGLSCSTSPHDNRRS